jgi:hypothetical protein
MDLMVLFLNKSLLSITNFVEIIPKMPINISFGDLYSKIIPGSQKNEHMPGAHPLANFVGIACPGAGRGRWLPQRIFIYACGASSPPPRYPLDATRYFCAAR